MQGLSGYPLRSDVSLTGRSLYPDFAFALFVRLMSDSESNKNATPHEEWHSILGHVCPGTIKKLLRCWSLGSWSRSSWLRSWFRLLLLNYFFFSNRAGSCLRSNSALHLQLAFQLFNSLLQLANFRSCKLYKFVNCFVVLSFDFRTTSLYFLNSLAYQLLAVSFAYFAFFY